MQKEDDYGRQPVHVAAGEDAVEILELFLDHGGKYRRTEIVYDCYLRWRLP